MSRIESEVEAQSRLAQASAWRVALSEADEETRDAFEAWIDSDPENEIAWDRVQDSWNMVGEMAESSPLLALRRAALNRAGRARAQRWPGEGWAPRMAACLALLLCAGIFYNLWPTSGPLVYATALGERRVVTLSDGSRILLDSSSEVQISYSHDARRLALLHGQARFDVAHDTTRPFTVHARDRTVVATGTAFNVDLIGPKMLVTLIEGRVVVLQDRVADARTIAAKGLAVRGGLTLKAGEQFAAAPFAKPTVEPVSLDRATSWESGQLIFDDETLGEIVPRIGRYAARQIRVDPAVADLRISGVFQAGEVATFLDTISRYLPVKSVPQSDGSILLQPRN